MATKHPYGTICQIALLIFCHSCWAGPVIQFDSDVFGGICTYGADRPFKFTFTNVGDQDLLIKNVQLTCGCTSAQAENDVVHPGERSSITGLYKVSPYRETFAVHVLVISNATNAPTKRLTIAGRNYPAGVTIKPRYLQLSAILHEDIGTESILVSTLETLMVRSVGLKSAKHPLSEGVGDVRADGANATDNDIFSVKAVMASEHLLKLDVRVCPPHRIGTYVDEVWIDARLNNKDVSFIIPIGVSVAPEFLLVPPRINIWPGMADKEYELRVLLKNRKGVPFSITSIACSEERIAVRPERTSSGSYYLHVQIRNFTPPQSQESLVKLNVVRDNQEITVELPIRTVAPSPPRQVHWDQTEDR